MAKVIPFKGLRYNDEKFADLNKVTAPPYDIIKPDKQDLLYSKSPYNIIRVDFGKVFEGDSDEDNCYTRASEALKLWIDDRSLIFEEKPAFYIYEQQFAVGSLQKSIKGIISLVHLEDFANGIIFPHEETISKAKTDRFNLMTATEANLSPIYSIYSDENAEIESIINSQTEDEPDISFVTDEGITQNIWVVTDEEVNAEITRLFEEKPLFIADGHHRYETALNYRNSRREAEGGEGEQPYDYTMMLLVSMENSGLMVFPTHRLIRGVEKYDEVSLVSYLTEDFNISKIFLTDGDYASIISDKLADTSEDEKVFALYTGDEYYYLLKLRDIETADAFNQDRSTVYRRLDATILHSLILERYLGIDKENMAEQKNLVYTRDIDEAISEVKDGDFQCAFLINASRVSDIKEISALHEKMPQKSTYFWPKPVTGIVMNKFTAE